MGLIKKCTYIFDKALTWVIIILFLMMFGVTNLGVIMRYFFNKPIIISVELGRYCFVSIIFLGAIFTTRADKHIHVDFFTGLLPKRMQAFMDQVGRVLMCIFFSVLTYFTFKMAMSNTKVVSSAMQIPMTVPYLVMTFGCAGIAVESAINIVLFQMGIKKKENTIEEGEL